MRFFLILSLTLFTYSFSIAQDGGVRLGIQASPTFTWLASEDNTISSNGLRAGFKIGPIGEFYFRENYAFISGINLVFSAGGTLTHQLGGNLLPETAVGSNTAGIDMIPDNSNIEYKIQSVEIPFGMKLRTNPIGYFRYFAEIPFIVGIKTQARGDISGAGLDTSKENISGDVNLVNVSWGIGGGVEYEISESTSIVGGLTFQGGFLDVTKNNGMQTNGGIEDSKVVQNAINLKIGVMF
ncbi:MAG: porin family protein [Bacteroidota bacterium]